MRGRIVVIVLALLAVGIAFAASRDDARTPPPASTAAHGPTPAPGALRVSLVYSPEKELLLKPLVARFNAERHAIGGRAVFVDARIMASGEAETKIATDKLHPTLWSPASSFWGRLLNYESDKLLVADQNPSIVRTPLVIAMWKRLADAYGYPKRKLGYKQLGELATGGWAVVGKPGFGAFKYVHTNPDFSTSGLSAVAASYYAAVDKKEGLTEADVTRGRSRVRRLERAIVHYGDTTLFVSDEMKKRGLGYASAAAMEETTLIDFNRRAGDGERLVAIYPEEGTFFSDNPLITLRGNWVSAAHKQAGQTFAAFLARQITPETAGRQGFRPADRGTAPAGLVSAANGVDPGQPSRVLRLPEPNVLAKIKSAWRADRKPANVLLVFDNSGSMGEERKLSQAQDGLKAFLRAAGRRDRMGLTKFSHRSTPLVPIGRLTANRAKLLAAAKSIVPEGDTHLRDAIVEGLNAVEATYDDDAINAVVVLTDGEDNVSKRTEAQVLRRLRLEGRKESGQIRVFTIAYGREPNEAELKRYADATGGRSYKGDPDEIESIYLKISSFF